MKSRSMTTEELMRFLFVTEAIRALEACDSKQVKWTWRRLLEQSFEIVGGEDEPDNDR